MDKENKLQEDMIDDAKEYGKERGLYSESIEQDENRYQLKKFDATHYGVYDNKQKRFLQKGSLNVMQAAVKAIKEGTVDNIEQLKDIVSDFKKEEKLEESVITGTDKAAEAIMKFSTDGKTLDEEWLNNEMQINLRNVKHLSDGVYNTRRPAHSVAYDSLVYSINTFAKFNELVDKDLTSKQIQAGFKKLGLDFKEIIKPSIEFVEEDRKELKEESLKPNDPDIEPETYEAEKEMKNLLDKISGWSKKEESFKVGDIYVNDKGAIIKIVEPTKAGEPQFNIAPSSKDYSNGKIDCRLMADNESLEHLLNENGYHKVTESTERKSDVELIKLRINAIKRMITKYEDLNAPQEKIDELNKTLEQVETMLYNYENPDKPFKKVEENLNPEQEIMDAVHKTEKDNLENGIVSEDEFILQCYDAYREVCDISDISKEYKNKIKEYAKQVYKNMTETKLEEDKTDTETVEDEEVNEEPLTILDELQNRIDQVFTVMEYNAFLQATFSKYEHIFIFPNELYDKDPNELQELVIFDDNDMYTITYEIVDLYESKIRMTDVTVD